MLLAEMTSRAIHYCYNMLQLRFFTSIPKANFTVYFKEKEASFIFQLTLFAAKAAPTILPFTVGAALAANLSTWQPGESVNYFNIYMKDALVFTTSEVI